MMSGHRSGKKQNASLGSLRPRRRVLLGTALLALAATPLLLPSLTAFACARSPASSAASLGRQQSAALQLRSPAASAPLTWGLSDLPSQPSVTGLQALQTPFSQPESKNEGPRDFFLFIKDYGWSLRYRVGLASESDLDQEKPLELQWVKLNKPIRSPSEILQADAGELFNWGKMEPAKHKGFMYHVTQVLESGVEAVINFFEGKGLKLLVTPETGIQLLLGEEAIKKAKAPTEEGPQSVTHCWVETRGMPFLPILQSIAFYDLANVVVDLQA